MRKTVSNHKEDRSQCRSFYCLDGRSVPDTLRVLAEQYNRPEMFLGDPIIFPREFAERMGRGEASLQDVEIAAVIAAHLAWGRRDMILRDCRRAFDEMGWQPFKYILQGRNGNPAAPAYRDDDASLHRTVKWSEFAAICRRLHSFYTFIPPLGNIAAGKKIPSLEILSPDEMRVRVFGQKSDPGAANKKIHMLWRWMVRRDGKVDLGLWRSISPADLVIPLDVHVHRNALLLGITRRKSTDFRTALEITEFLKSVFPGDPVLGDFALFAVTANGNGPSTDSQDSGPASLRTLCTGT